MFQDFDEVQTAFSHFHSSSTSGNHSSFWRTWKKLTMNYYCRNLFKVLESVIRTCPVCVLHQPLPSTAPLMSIITSRPNELVCVSVGALETCNSKIVGCLSGSLIIPSLGSTGFCIVLTTTANLGLRKGSIQRYKVNCLSKALGKL